MATIAAPPSAAVKAASDRSKPAAAPGRLVSLDVFRGLTMLLLISHGFGFHTAFQQSAPWLAYQFEHAAWVGCTFWDLIQPAFTFIVGVAMPFSLSRRIAEGGQSAAVWKHVLWRAFLLIALANVLSNWNSSKGLQLQLINVLCQIAFSYVICYLILQLKFPMQVVAAIGLMVFHHGLFFAFPGPQGAFDQSGNIGAVIDRAVLGYNYPGFYTTINFLGNAVTVLFGAWTGLLLLEERSHASRLRILAACSAAAFALGLALAPFLPMVKRLWLGSFTFFSAGWVLLGLLVCYWMIEVQGWRRWTFPAVVIGTNCIFIYSFAQVLRGWLARGIGNFTHNFDFLGVYGAIPLNLAVMAAMWGMCYWLYRHRIFFKI